MEARVNIYIDIRDDISPEVAMACVQKVIAGGKVSKGSNRLYYCWCTVFEYNQEKIAVQTKPYRKSDCFVVYKPKHRSVPEQEE